MNINIPTRKLRFLAELMIEVLHEKKAVNAIGSTADDFENQIDWILRVLKDKDLNSYESLLQSKNNLDKMKGE
jgi:folylpolyglutamate synthase/dihydropteroate synthase